MGQHRASLLKNVDKIMNGVNDSVGVGVDLDEMELVEYGNSGTVAYFDGENYYNEYGQKLKNPEEYNEYFDGYTPFGDE